MRPGLIRRAGVWSCSLLLAACNVERNDPDKLEGSSGAQTVELRERAWVEPRRDHLLLIGSARSEPHVRPVVLGPRGEPRPQSLLAIPPWVALAHGGGERFVVATARADPYRIELRDFLASEPLASVQFTTAPPVALHMVGEQVIVGQPGRLSVIDFSAATPSLELLRERPELGSKAYDVFARDGPWLLAIDDILMPIYADSFVLGSGAPLHRAGFELPDVVNGSYQLALLHATDSGVGTLYAIVEYGVLSGWGHDFLAVPMRDAAPASDASTSGGVRVLGEHQPRDGGDASLLAGKQLTRWTGLARVEVDGHGSLLIAAGERGLLRIADDFSTASRPTIHELGGACLDVLAVGDRVFVLRETSEEPHTAALVELSLRVRALMPVTTIELDGSYRGFVR